MPSASAARGKRVFDPRKILRFRGAERTMHWCVALPFLTCYTTALILVFHYNHHPLDPHRNVISWIHRISGVCLAVFPLLAAVKNWRDHKTHLSNIQQAWSWTFDDLKWLCLMGFAAVSSRFSLPEQGKFNAAEKLNFMLVMLSWPLLIGTGLLIWLPGVELWAWFVHVGIAALYTPFLLGHVFMATVNPDTRKGLGGMITGFVDRQWAKHHYGRWYRENFERARHVEQAQRTPVRRRSQPILPTAGKIRHATYPLDIGRRRREPGRNRAVTQPEGDAALHPKVLHTLCLMYLRAGNREAAVRLGREALDVCRQTSHPTLAVGLFRELWPHLQESDLSTEQVLGMLRLLIQERDYATAAKVFSWATRRNGGGSLAIEYLMEIAKSELHPGRAPGEAPGIYDFLLTHCADSPHLDTFRKGLHQASAR